MNTSAQSADEAWLRYRPVQKKLTIPGRVSLLNQRPVTKTAAEELRRGLAQMFPDAPAESGPTFIVLGTAQEMRWRKRKSTVLTLAPDEFVIQWDAAQLKRELDVIGGGDQGVLYGVFALLRNLAQGADLSYVSLREKPAMPIRWVDEWDNLDGSIERGYGGRSIFFEGGNVRDDLKPVEEYARLLASVGINGCNINNVNNAASFLQAEMLKQVARIADAMRPWGVRVALSVDIASPQKIGGLKTYDPADPEVAAWWKAKVDEIYTFIPDLAGFTVKADSEGQPGPASYGRTPADAANVLANALAPHGGVVLYRAFVYNHHLDWNDPKADRARAAYDIFHPLDGKFAPNVIVQVKEGPIDFQAQEPVSPLFAGLEKTNQAMELQITQEYLGQQRHLVYIAPMWKWVLDFDLRGDNRSTPVKEIIEGKTFKRPLGGMVGVSCVGRDWLGSPLALANLYAFGRLAWNPELKPADIAVEWTRQTIGTDTEVVRTVATMLMQSWPAYLHYTGPLGMQTLTDITGSHYGPNIEASENNGWGQWHRADHEGVGMDRTVATGTGYARQYPPELAKKYEDVKTTPDELLTFFHHVPYTWKLHDGSTVIQYIYDIHYQGAAEAAQLGAEWATLDGKVDPGLFKDVQARLAYQAGHAIVWRDAIVQYFLKLSGITDERGRAGQYPNRLEAEDARLTNYQVIDVKPWEDASGGKAVSCQNTASAVPGNGPENDLASNTTSRKGTTSVVPNTDPQDSRALAPEQTCTAEWTYQGKAGTFNIAVRYFDLQGGEAKFDLTVNGQTKANWVADVTFPSRHPNGDNSTRYLVPAVDLKPGDVITVKGTPDKNDPAALDYIEMMPASHAQP